VLMFSLASRDPDCGVVVQGSTEAADLATGHKPSTPLPNGCASESVRRPSLVLTC
jgi:hypothetical protein